MSKNRWDDENELKTLIFVFSSYLVYGMIFNNIVPVLTWIIIISGWSIFYNIIKN